MINLIRVLTRNFSSKIFCRRELVQRSFNLKLINHYSKENDDEYDLNGKKLISLSKQQIDRMRQILREGSSAILEGQQKQGEDFFQGEQAKLSLKLIQMDNIQQLKPLITHYSIQLQFQVSDRFRQTLRCKFLILYKYINIGGSPLSKQIQLLYKDIVRNLKYLDESQLTIFFRLVAHNEEIKQDFKKMSTKVILIDQPSHTNSELMSLLLMIYPNQKDQVYKRYCLHLKKREENYRQGYVQPQKQIIYDPINLMHIISHYYYYDDLHALLENTMRIKSIQEKDSFLEEFIKTQEDFLQRKVQAIIFAINQNLQAVYNKYLTNEYFDFQRLQIKESSLLLKSIVLSQKCSSQKSENIKLCAHQLSKNILNKSEQFLDDEESQIQQNASYKDIGQIISSFLRKKHSFLQQDDMVLLIKNLYGSISNWRIKFDLFSIEELFALIVSYKASRDYLKGIRIQLDQNSTIFTLMLASFNNLITAEREINQIQIFYVSLFALQLSSLSHLKNKIILKELIQFSKKQQLSVVAQQNLNKIITQLQNVQQ